jgi:ankyrin repeat protein
MIQVICNNQRSNCRSITMIQSKAFIFALLLSTGGSISAVQAVEPVTEGNTAAVQLRTATNSEPSDLNENEELQTPSNSAQDILQLQRYFFAAARTGEQAVLTEFLKAGYPVNERNEQSYTALMIAAYAGQATAVELLLQAGADACLRDKRGHTALMGAMIKAEWDIARNLYSIDCDKENTAKATDVVTDKSQMTAAQFAEVFGQSERFKALSERGKIQH